MKRARLFNRTRQTEDLAARFRNERRWDLLLLHKLLQRSFLGREGIKNSGSFRFADHLYKNIPGGEGISGWLLDRVLLNLPAARTMRQRYIRSKTEMLSAFKSHPSESFRLLTIPCGIPRDVTDFIASVRNRSGTGWRSIEYWGMDLDPDALETASEHLAAHKVRNFHLVRGDALRLEDYPDRHFDFVASTGLGEFLADEQLQAFYLNIHRVLRSGGLFYTSALDRELVSEWLLQSFELRANYRSEAKLRSVLTGQPWQTVRAHKSAGQTYILARR